MARFPALHWLKSLRHGSWVDPAPRGQSTPGDDRRAGWMLVLVLSSLAACASQGLPGIPAPSASLSDRQIQERTAFIEERLDASRRHAQGWYTGWLAASLGGIAIGGTQAALADDAADRAAGIATAVLAVGGVAYLELLPMNARHGTAPLQALPDRTRAERLDRLARAQDILVENGQRATVQVDWWAHAANAAAALAAGGIVWAVGDEAGLAGTVTAMTLVGGELQFWTEPSAPRRDVEDYVARFATVSASPRRGLHIGAAAGGLLLRWDF